MVAKIWVEIFINWYTFTPNLALNGYCVTTIVISWQNLCQCTHEIPSVSSSQLCMIQKGTSIKNKYEFKANVQWVSFLLHYNEWDKGFLYFPGLLYVEHLIRVLTNTGVRYISAHIVFIFFLKNQCCNNVKAMACASGMLQVIFTPDLHFTPVLLPLSGAWLAEVL